MDNAGYVVAGYAITVGAVGAYLLHLLSRARRARARTEALAETRRP